MKNLTRLVLGLLSFAAFIQAQGFYWNTASASSMGLGGIYVPSSSHVLDSLAANPAGQATLDSPIADLSAAGIFVGDFEFVEEMEALDRVDHLGRLLIQQNRNDLWQEDSHLLNLQRTIVEEDKTVDPDVQLLGECLEVGGLRLPVDA